MERPPLPTVDDIAGPILRGLLALHDLGAYDGMVDGLDFAFERGEFRDEANALVALVEGVATAVEIGVNKFLPTQRQATHASNARAIVMAIVDVDELRNTVHTPEHERITYDD